MGRDEDNAMLKKNKKQVKRASLFALTNGDAVPGGVGMDSVNSMTVKPEYSPAIQEILDSAKAGEKVGNAWLQCGRHSCGREAPPQSSKEKYPQIYYLCCCKAIILSQQHVALMLLFFLGFISIGLNVAYLVIAVANNHNENDAGHPYTGVSFFTFIVLQLVVFLLLVKFEEIDVVQRLEKGGAGVESPEREGGITVGEDEGVLGQRPKFDRTLALPYRPSS